ncbi:integrase, partial [Gordonia terrae]|nr:integrase [Gordonia terrae]
LYAWLRAIRDDSSTTITVGDFLREADHRLKQPERKYTFCVPVEKVGGFDVKAAAGWMTAQETAQWKRTHAKKVHGMS